MCNSASNNKIKTNMKINIGTKIREELRHQGRTDRWLADQICVHIRTVQKLYHKTSIDTQQLLTISRVLDFDFFKIYSDELASSNNTKCPNTK